MQYEWNVFSQWMDFASLPSTDQFAKILVRNSQTIFNQRSHLGCLWRHNSAFLRNLRIKHAQYTMHSCYLPDPGPVLLEICPNRTVAGFIPHNMTWARSFLWFPGKDFAPKSSNCMRFWPIIFNKSSSNQRRRTFFIFGTARSVAMLIGSQSQCPVDQSDCWVGATRNAGLNLALLGKVFPKPLFELPNVVKAVL